jgi:cobalamin biosynthesis Co2+ chelatase CbiK
MHRIISLVDLRSVPEAREIMEANDAAAWYRLLHDIGFDVNRDIEMEVVAHRPMTSQEVVTCPRWVGHERRDDVWMASEHCTFENKLEVIGIKDLAFQRELVAMGATPNYTAMFIDHIRQSSKKKNNKAGE